MADTLSRDFDALEVGGRFRTRGRTITESDLVAFSALTGDHHPLHTDAEWAAESEFNGRIAHGMLLLSYSVGLVPLDPEHVLALRGFERVAFKRPVRIGDTIHVEGELESKKELDAAQRPRRLRLEAGQPARRGGRAGQGPGRLAPRRGAGAGRRRPGAGLPVILEGKRLLVTGVVNRRSIAFAIAERAQQQGAEVVLTSFGRVRADDRTRRRAARPGARGARARRQRRRRPRLAAGRAGRPLGPGRRRRPRDRLRPPRRARRRVPRHPAGERQGRLRDQRLLVQGAGRGAGAADGGGRRRARRPRLRRHRRLAVLRLDGRRQGGAGVGQPLPRPRPRAPGRPRQPRRRRPDPHRRRLRRPRLRRARIEMVRAGAAAAGTSTTRPRSPTPRSSSSPTSPAPPPARSSTSTAASTRSAPPPHSAAPSADGTDSVAGNARRIRPVGGGSAGLDRRAWLQPGEGDLPVDVGLRSTRSSRCLSPCRWRSRSTSGTSGRTARPGRGRRRCTCPGGRTLRPAARGSRRRCCRGSSRRGPASPLPLSSRPFFLSSPYCRLSFHGLTILVPQSGLVGSAPPPFSSQSTAGPVITGVKLRWTLARTGCRAAGRRTAAG